MSSRPNYSLTQLEYVLAIHKTGSFARAAELCHVTQPTLSMQVQKLETELGGAIFDRSKKPLLLTDLGKKLIKQIQSLVRAARVLHQMAASCSGT
ncbi:MAG: LysR family transcriptional regulator, partial [Bdellovibrionaceae bacterium]|nr:LysR family transcriptional regulator [Pseudobdellovibrionaceae bacterium]